MDPIFAKPESVFSLPDQAAFVALLEQFEVPYQKWENSDAKIAKLWKEVTKGDTVYTTGDLFGVPHALVRHLITTSVRVMLKHHSEGFMVLIEFVSDGAYYRPRKYADSSLSEKAFLNPDGTLKERNLNTIHRCLREEVKIEVALRRLGKGLKFTSYPNPTKLVGGARHIEQEFHEKILQMKGLWHFNQVAHYVAYLPESCYFLGWRKDDGTRYLSRWRSTRETSTEFEDPIPVELVL